MSSERGWLGAAGAGVAALLLARSGGAVESSTGVVFPCSLLAGIALWAAWRFGIRGLACVAVAGLANGLWRESEIGGGTLSTAAAIRSAGGALALTAQAFAGAWFAARSLPTRPVLGRATDVVRFVAAQAVACALGVAIGWAALRLAPDAAVTLRPLPWPAAFTSEFLGVLFLAPALFVLTDPERRRLGPAEQIEAALLAACIAGVGVATATRLLGLEPSFERAQALLVPCLLWAALRLGQPGATLSFTLATVVAWLSWLAASGRTEAPSSLAPQSFVAIAGLTSFVLAASIEERRAASEGLREARDELERRVQRRTNDLESTNRLLQAESVERSHVEQALRESEARLHAIVEHLPFEVWLHDRDGRCVMQNRRSTASWGDVTGKRIEEYTVDAAVRARLLDHHGRALAGEVVADAYEQRTGDVTRAFDSIVAPVRENEEVKGVVGASIDATERRELYAQLQQSQRMESIGRLAGGIAHDFNNVLTAILGYAEIVQLKIPPQHAVAGDVREIQRAAQRAADLTRQLLVFSRKHAPRPRVVGVDELVVGVQKLLRRTLGETIELTVDTHCGPASVNVDPGQFEQVLMNLAMRARDAMKSGGALAITTRADCEAGPGMAPGRFVAVEVSDTGATLENIERAFEPYFASSDKSEASGLELATVYAIVKQAGGDVRVTSEAGRGTRFTIVLPTCTAAEDPAPALPKSKGLEGTETLILVEDEPLVRRITAAELRARGYTVLEAVDGEDALRQARSHAGRLECVVTDLVMPRLGGEDLVRQLRPQRPGIRVLFVSGYSIESQPFAATSDPDVAFLGKPFGPAELSRALRELLDRAPRA